MACAAIIKKARNYMGGPLTEHLLKRLFRLGRGKSRLELVVYGAEVLPIPLYPSFGTAIDGVDGIRGDE